MASDLENLRTPVGYSCRTRRFNVDRPRRAHESNGNGTGVSTTSVIRTVCIVNSNRLIVSLLTPTTAARGGSFEIETQRLIWGWSTPTKIKVSFRRNGNRDDSRDRFRGRVSVENALVGELTNREASQLGTLNVETRTIAD